MAVNEAAMLGVCKEGDGPGDILGVGETGHRDASLDIRVRVASSGLILMVYLGSRTPKIPCCAFVLCWVKARKTCGSSRLR
jgi:hypothetical protein